MNKVSRIMNEFELPHLDRAVGEKPENQEQFGNYLFRRFLEGGEKIPELEIEKSEKDLEIIKLVDRSVNDYLYRYGRQRIFEIPRDNIHVLKSGGVEKFTEGNFERGYHDLGSGSILADRKKSDVDFALALFHEDFHLKSYKASQLVEGTSTVDAYRFGFAVISRDGKKIYFEGTNEAIAAFMTERFYREVLSKNSLFEEEIKKITESGRPRDFSRRAERRHLDKLIDKLWQANRGQFRDREEIKELFIEAGVTGRLLKVGRLVEKTFGRGSFRTLGEKTGIEYSD